MRGRVSIGEASALFCNVTLQMILLYAVWNSVCLELGCRLNLFIRKAVFLND